MATNKTNQTKPTFIASVIRRSKWSNGDAGEGESLAIEVIDVAGHVWEVIGDLYGGSDFVIDRIEGEFPGIEGAELAMARNAVERAAERAVQEL
jgi:hypothetical protein